ncbi:DEAD/DEAH box helicase [Paraliobacillus sediminis]|uniref:DEAD/DEAH box helicase n=1 Tax=Paraliobacillus sediminis TaxID=1885916 RepID=UPI001F081045|nr:DEAD/DEAH box helicase [Paraliobacillus sediminis]
MATDFNFLPTPTTTAEKSSDIPPFAGKLLLREEMDISDDTLASLIELKHLQKISAITPSFNGKHYQCRRCGNKQHYYFALIPCARCQTEHVYCRYCIEMGRVMMCTPLYYWTGPQPLFTLQDNPCKWKGELTPAQQNAANKIEEAMVKGREELLVWAVCGAGKTEMLFQGIATAIKQGKRVCLATPRADVVRELIPRFEQAFPKTPLAGLYGGAEVKVENAQLILATTHQLLRYAHAFGVVIIDEVDAFPFHADASLPYAASRATKPDATTIYLTATPRQALKKRSNQGKLATVFVPVRFHGHPLPEPKLRLTTLKKSLTAKQLPRSFWSWFARRERATRQLLIFVPTIQLATDLLPSLKTQLPDKKIAAVHASDPDREEKVQLFRQQNLDIILTTTILERGVTFPSVDVAVIDAGHEVFDEAALVQIAGRAGRSPNDPTGEVIFFHDGKTNAMLRAGQAINQMNKKGRRH